MKPKIKSIVIVLSILIITPALLYLHFCVITDDCRKFSKVGSDETYVFSNANIIPLSEEIILENYSLIVRGDRIIKVAPAQTVKVPKGATIIDASGKYLIPAFSDMHVHLEGDAWNMIYSEEMKFKPDEIDYEDILFLYIANGITTINVMSAFPEHIAIRDSINKNKLFGPQLVLSRMIDGAGQAWPPPISTWVTNPEEAIEAIVDAKEIGYDRIKVYSFLDKASYDSIFFTAANLEIPVDGHIPLSTSVEYVASSGQSMIAHSEEILKFSSDYSPQEISRLSSLLINNNVWLTATLITSRNLIKLFNNPEWELSKPGTEYLHPQSRGTWKYIYRNLYKPVPDSQREYIKSGFEDFQIPFVYKFHSSGGKLLAGTDALIPPNLPGVSLHEELSELVNAGISSFDVLKIACANPHEFLEDLNERGTLEEGKIADIILLGSNPLDDISSTRDIEGVFTRSKWISKEDIKNRLEQISNSYYNLMPGHRE